MLNFVVVQSEIWSNDGSVHTLEEAYKMVEELQNCISEMETRPTKRAADEAYCTENCIDDPNKIGWVFCPYCGKRLRR